MDQIVKAGEVGIVLNDGFELLSLQFRELVKRLEKIASESFLFFAGYTLRVVKPLGPFFYQLHGLLQACR